MAMASRLPLLFSSLFTVGAWHGPIVRGPITSGSRLDAFVPATGGEWVPNLFYAGGPDVFIAAQDTAVIFNVRHSVEGASVYCVIDGRAVAVVSSACNVSFLSYGSLHSVAAYVNAASFGTQRIGDAIFFMRAHPAAGDTQLQLRESERRLQAATPAGTGRLGVYYTTYQQVDSQLYQNISRMFGFTRSMEQVLRNASLQLADSIWRYAAAASSPAWRNHTPGIMSQQPALGMYCYYRKRANESFGQIPDCPEASRVLQAHAAEMTAAGFEFVAPDATNWDQDPRNASNGADLFQLRPTEVLAEEWANMRLRGEATPAISTIDQVNVGGVLYQWYLSEFFNNDTLLDLGLILREPNTTRVPGNRKVYIVADEGSEVDYNLVRQIQSNGGRDDIVTPLLWAAPDASGNYEANGYLKYFSPCTDTVRAPNGTSTRVFSTDIILDVDSPCNHLKTHNSPIGDVWTISTGLPCNSMPFSGSRMNGLFLKKQFWDGEGSSHCLPHPSARRDLSHSLFAVFADDAPTDYLFAPSWNEFNAGANPMSRWSMTNPYFYASGAASNDPNRSTIWLDGYSLDGSRTIEPSVEDGGYYYELFASCMRVYRLQAHLGIVGDGTGCAVAGEECCVLHADEAFTRVWSLELPAAATAVVPASAAEGLEQVAAADSLLTSDPAELAALVAAGWVQLCAPWGDANNGQPTGVCLNSSLPWAGPDINAARGPLMLLVNTSASRDLPGTAPLVRCVTVAAPPRHFVDSSAACAGGVGTPETLLGYGARSRDGLFMRDVHRCEVAGGPTPRWYTVANAPCAPGDTDQGVLLYAL